MTTHRFYTVTEVSALTGMSQRWLWTQARQHKIPHHKLGGRYRWTDEDMLALARQSAVGSAADDLIPLRGGRGRR